MVGVVNLKSAVRPHPLGSRIGGNQYIIDSDAVGISAAEQVLYWVWLREP